MKTILVDGMPINDSDRCYVIAEIGQNHQGDVEKAKEMFHMAKRCGADAVKLQKRHNKSLFTQAIYNSPYDHENSFGKTYGSHREALEFGRKEYQELQKCARETGITLFATAYDLESADFLADFDMPAFKIASGDLKNTPLQRYIAGFGKPIFLSTGGGTLEDVRRAYDTIMPINPQLCIMQCTASYPAQVEDLNLRVISRYKDHFPEAIIGLSDHQNGITMAVVGYTLGARVIEKHFTLDRALRGTDHSYSLEPMDMRQLVRDLRRVSLALGSEEKIPLDCETKTLHKMGKKLVAAYPLKTGQVLRREDVAIRAPGDGLPPFELDNVLGKAVTKDLEKDENFSFEILF